MSENPGGEDYCEYVFNPLMRQYQAMVRLIRMLRESQATDCNDLQCFTNPNDPSNPMASLGARGSSDDTGGLLGSSSSMLIMFFVWALFVLALFMFRPASMRGSRSAAEPSKNGGNLSPDGRRNNNNNHRRRNNDDDAGVS